MTLMLTSDLTLSVGGGGECTPLKFFFSLLGMKKAKAEGQLGI